MTLSLYVMPISGTGTSVADRRQPKYTSTFSAPFASGSFDYGNEPWCLVGIVDIDAPTDAALRGNGDVMALPSDLDQQIGTAQVTVQNRLESVNIPGTWVQTTSSWRDVALFVAACCQFAQRYQGNVGGRWFSGAVTLDSVFSSLPASVRNGLIATANSFVLDTSGITGASTLRQIIQSAAQQLVAIGQPLILAGLSLYTA